MAGGLATIAKIPELRRRIVFTGLMLAVYRIGCFIPTPGVDADALMAFFARQQRTIGSSLAARVVIEAPEDVEQFLRSFDDLHFLFIVSEIEFGPAGDRAVRSEGVPGLAVRVEPARGTKCERCWNFTNDVGADGEWPSICSRCCRAVRRIASGAGPS